MNMAAGSPIKEKESGQFATDVGNVIALIVLIAIGAFVTYSVTDAFNPTEGSYADNAISNVEEKGATAFNLMTILVIVIVAAVIIGVVLRALGGAGGGMGGGAAAPAYIVPRF